MLTFGQFKEGRARRISGMCPDSEDFAQFTNDATRELMKRGSFSNTLRRLHTCVYNGCLVWPRFVGTVLAFQKCGNSIPPRNQWFGFSSVLAEDLREFGRGDWNGQCRGAYALEALGTTPVLAQPPCLNDRYARFYPTRLADVGKIITIFGIDSNGQVIRSARSDGIYRDGVELTLAAPYVQSPMLIRRIDQVVKALTQGDVSGLWSDGSNLYTMAFYAPSETNPEYVIDKVAGCWTNNTYCGPSQVSALIKLKFAPVEYDDDLILIDNEDALAMGIQALKLQDSYDAQGAELLWAQAVKNLNHQIRTLMPVDTIPRRAQTQGTADLRKQSIGRLM